MKNRKWSRVFRFSLRTFLAVVLVVSAGIAWLTNANVQHQRELMTIDNIRNSAAESQVHFEIVQKSQLNPLTLILR